MPKPFPTPPLLVPLELHPATRAATHVGQELPPLHCSSTPLVKVCSFMICVYCLISYFPKLWVLKFWWFWVIFWISICSYWYEFCWFGMDFVVFLVFSWVLIGLGSNLKKTLIVVIFCSQLAWVLMKRRWNHDHGGSSAFSRF